MCLCACTYVCDGMYDDVMLRQNDDDDDDVMLQQNDDDDDDDVMLRQNDSIKPQHNNRVTG